ncbi:hypothetical protein DOK67_0000991 [Enterococcus sp. DIV0212c]|uniref:TPM domain-containing protein n=1 Tax=Enterococcus sp. DIV0212c TaxID=2230867 RepID=UPI001A9BF717|nr:TPM domain-containing protein [Enterococcus sp. DIV0212c]MBO1352690.1 TPM domain-containing protein [Enterococcus sp. DIV0212c]
MRCLQKVSVKRLLLFVLLINVPIAAYAEEKNLPEAPTHFCLDQLNILNQETQQLVDDKGEYYKGQPKNPQVVVGVINSTEGDSIDSYAPQLFKKWRIGNQEYDNGILILYALNAGERNVIIEVGYGLEDVITDSKAMNILISQKDKLKSSDPEVQVSKKRSNAYLAFDLFFNTHQKTIHPIVFERLYFPRIHHTLYPHDRQHLCQKQR